MLFLNAHRILCRPLIQYKILASFYRKLHASNSTENLLSGLVCHKKSMPKKYKEYEFHIHQGSDTQPLLVLCNEQIRNIDEQQLRRPRLI